MRLAQRLNADIVKETPLAGGCVGDVRRLTLSDGREVVAKMGAGLGAEGFMLSYLAQHTALPVPEVLLAEDDLLVMTYIENGARLTAHVQADAAQHLARLHDITGATFGFERDTVIGGLPQANPPTASWRNFFRDYRIMAMAHEALRTTHLPITVFGRLEKFCEHLDRWIPTHSRPSLIHGDMWSGNILCRDDRIAAFIDPAIYFADAEIELAFSTLFGTFDEAFFKRYAELRPIAPGFFEERRDIYNLYPLLVHVRLFGGSYVTDVEATLSRFGY